MQRREFLKKSVLGLAASATLSGWTCSQPPKRPNILFAISDDQSWPHTSAYGSEFVNTPAFDRVAREGVLFHNAFVCAPQCSPNRASILTGRYIWQNEEAGTHASSFPRHLPVFTEALKDSGYQLGYTGKPWGPGNWQISGWERNPVGPEFSDIKYDDPPQDGIRNLDYAANFEAFLDQKSADEPFFFWYGASEPHRSYKQGSGLAAGKELENVTVPAFLPDHPVIRGDMLDYAIEIEWFDTHLERMLDMLEERGELENTLVVVTSDNGMPFPRAKANLYEYGIHMPLAVRWGERVKEGREVDDLISFVDFAPTFLDAAGVTIPQGVTGSSFLDVLLSTKNGQVNAERQQIFTGRERHTHARPDNLAYPSRAIRTSEFLYIWNLKPDRWPAGNPTGSGEPHGFHDIDACPAKTFILERRDDYPDLAAASLDKRPEEELYDIQSDPACMNNLVDDPQYEQVRTLLRAELQHTLEETGDPRMRGSEIFESYPRYSRMRDFPGFKERGEYNPEYQ